MTNVLTNKVQVLYEKSLPLNGVYRFKSNISISKLIIDIAELIGSTNLCCTARIYNEFGYVNVKDINELRQEIEKPENITMIDVELSNASENFDRAINIYFSEFETIKKKCSITVIGSDKGWIKSCIESINSKIYLYKVSFPLLKSAFARVVLLVSILTLFYASAFGIESMKKKFTPTDFLVMGIYIGIFYFLIFTFQDVFVPKFKITTKAKEKVTLMKKIIMKMNEDVNFTATVLIGVCGIVITIFFGLVQSIIGLIH